MSGLESTNANASMASGYELHAAGKNKTEERVKTGNVYLESLFLAAKIMNVMKVEA